MNNNWVIVVKTMPYTSHLDGSFLQNLWWFWDGLFYCFIHIAIRYYIEYRDDVFRGHIPMIQFMGYCHPMPWKKKHEMDYGLMIPRDGRV